MLWKQEKRVRKFSEGDPWSQKMKRKHVFLSQTYSSKIRNSSSIERIHVLKAHTPKQLSDKSRSSFTDLHTCKKWKTVWGECTVWSRLSKEKNSLEDMHKLLYTELHSCFTLKGGVWVLWSMFQNTPYLCGYSIHPTEKCYSYESIWIRSRRKCF